MPKPTLAMIPTGAPLTEHALHGWAAIAAGSPRVPQKDITAASVDAILNILAAVDSTEPLKLAGDLLQQGFEDLGTCRSERYRALVRFYNVSWRHADAVSDVQRWCVVASHRTGTRELATDDSYQAARALCDAFAQEAIAAFRIVDLDAGEVYSTPWEAPRRVGTFRHVYGRALQAVVA